jgi:hypothetical protein
MGFLSETFKKHGFQMLFTLYRKQRTLRPTVTAMTLDHIIAAMILNTIVAFGTIVAYFILLVGLLTSSPVMWPKEHL